MADQTGKSDNNPKKPISEEEYKKGLISDIRPIQARPEKKDPLENLTGNSGDFSDTEDIEDEEDQEIIDDESSEEEQDDQPELSRDDIERLTKDQRIKETPEQQLEKNKVPEYKAEPPEAYKKPPGGPAIKPTGTAAKAEQGAAKAGQGAAKTAQGAAQSAKNTAQAAAKAGQAVVKAIQATVAGIRNAVAAIGALFSSAPAWVPVVLIILGILIIVGAVVIFLKARSTPNANGASPTIAVDILADRPLIKTILSLSSPEEFQKVLTENKQGLIAEISSFETEVNRNFPGDQRLQTTLAKLSDAKQKISDYDGSDPSKAQEIMSLIIDAVKPWTVDLNPDGLIIPLGRGYSKNNISSPYLQRRETYIHRGIDIVVPIGKPYYAAATGVVVYAVDTYRDNIDMGYGRNANGGFGGTIVVKISQGPWTGYLWEIHHVKTGSLLVKKGDTVYQGQLIAQSGHNGASSKPHLHFQVNKPGGECERWNTQLGRPCGVTSDTIDPNIPLGWVPCPAGYPCNQ